MAVGTMLALSLYPSHCHTNKVSKASDFLWNSISMNFVGFYAKPMEFIQNVVCETELSLMQNWIQHKLNQPI